MGRQGAAQLPLPVHQQLDPLPHEAGAVRRLLRLHSILQPRSALLQAGQVLEHYCRLPSSDNRLVA